MSNFGIGFADAIIFRSSFFIKKHYRILLYYYFKEKTRGSVKNMWKLGKKINEKAVKPYFTLDKQLFS